MAHIGCAIKLKILFNVSLGGLVKPVRRSLSLLPPVIVSTVNAIAS